MAKNLEIKAYCNNLKKTESIIKEIATEFVGIDSQIDTYFTTKQGRFKLRESTLSGSYLIPYVRPNQTEAKISPTFESCHPVSKRFHPRDTEPTFRRKFSAPLWMPAFFAASSCAV